MSTLRYTLLIALALLVGCDAPQAPGESATDDGAFVATLGEDTVAVETFRRTADGMEADVILTTPKTTIHHYALALDDSGNMRRFEATDRTPADSVIRREVYVAGDDSLELTIEEGGETETRTIAGDQSALPFIDMVHWPFELMLTRAHASESDSTVQQLFTGRGTMPFVVERQGEGRMSVAHPYRGTMEVEVDDEGRLVHLDAGATTRALTVERTGDVDFDGIADRFAARDRSGSSFGPLSGRGETTANVDGATISLDYGQPHVRGREIFGALVPWGEVWRTGANRATHFETDTDLLVGGLDVPAGEYTLYTIPEPEGGTLIINTRTGQGGTSYDEARDLGRVPMEIRSLEQQVEPFTIAVEDTEEGGELKLQWDRTEFAVPISVNSRS